MSASMMYPVVLDLTGRPCLVVGGGRIAARKAAGLLASGAVVTAVAPVFSAAFDELAGCRRIEREYRPADLAGVWFVIAATDDRAANAAIGADAEAARVWANVADQPDDCTVYLPAIVRRGPVSVAVSTSGRAPALASWLRDRIGEQLDLSLGDVADQLARDRAEVHASGGSTEGVDWQARIDELLAAPA